MDYFYRLYGKDLKNGDYISLLFWKKKGCFFLIPAIMISKDPCRCSISLLFLSFELEFYIQWDLPF